MKIYPYNDLYANLYSNFTHNRKLKTQIARLMYKLIMIHPYNRILLGNEKIWTMNTCDNMVNLKHSAYNEARHKRVHTLAWFYLCENIERTIHSDQKRQWLSGTWGEKGDWLRESIRNLGTTEEFYAFIVVIVT